MLKEFFSDLGTTEKDAAEDPVQVVRRVKRAPTAWTAPPQPPAVYMPQTLPKFRPRECASGAMSALNAKNELVARVATIFTAREYLNLSQIYEDRIDKATKYTTRANAARDKAIAASSDAQTATSINVRNAQSDKTIAFTSEANILQRSAAAFRDAAEAIVAAHREGLSYTKCAERAATTLDAAALADSDIAQDVRIGIAGIGSFIDDEQHRVAVMIDKIKRVALVDDGVPAIMRDILRRFKLNAESTAFDTRQAEADFENYKFSDDPAVQAVRLDSESEASTTTDGSSLYSNPALQAVRDNVERERRALIKARVDEVAPAASCASDSPERGRVQLAERAKPHAPVAPGAILPPRKKTTAAIITDLRADSEESATGARSRARLCGANAACRVLSGDEAVCAEGVRFPGEHLRANYASVAALRKARSQFGEIPESIPIPHFEQSHEESQCYSLVSSALTTACIPMSSVAAGCTTRVTAAKAIASLFTRQTFLDTNAPDLLTVILTPLVAASRVEIGASNWLDVGRAMCSSFGTNAGREVWSEVTAQKLFLTRVREWFVSASGIRLTEPAQVKTANERKVIRWLLSFDGRGLSALRGDDDESPFPLGTREDFAYTADPLDAIYCIRSFDAPLSENVFGMIAGDPFLSRICASLFCCIASVCPSAKASDVSLIAEDFFAFRDEYRAVFRAAHIDAAQRFLSGDANIMEGAKDFGRAASAEDLVPHVRRPRHRPRVVGSAVYESIRSTATNEHEVWEKAHTATFGKLCVNTLATPEDFEWSSTDEFNCALMFIDAIQKDSFIESQRNARSARIKRICDEVPSIAEGASALDTNEGVANFLTGLTRLTSKDDVSAAVAFAISNTRRETDPAVARGLGEIESEQPRVTVRTLGAFAQSDSPTEFAVWKGRWAMVALLRAAADSRSACQAVGEFASRLLWQRYVCVHTTTAGGSSSAAWYKFDDGGHYLKRMSGTSSIAHDIDAYVGCVFKDITGDITTHHAAAVRKHESLVSTKRASDDEAEFVKTAVEHLKKIQRGLSDLKVLFNTSRGKASVIDAMRCSGILTYTPLDTLANEEPSLIAFENGVVDLGGAGMKVSFRPGKIEDCITKSTLINMPYGGEIAPPIGYTGDLFSEDHADVIFGNTYHNQVFPEPELAHYAKLDIASFYFGRNARKLFRIWSGTRNNSKSIIVKILQKMFGNYCFDIPPEAVSSKQLRNASAPSPELAQGAGTRLGVMSEPSCGLELDSGLIKRYTGGDRQFSRGLHENGSSKTLCYNVVLCCNFPPNMSGFDEASRNRIVIVPFLSQWTKNAPESVEEQIATHHFPVDPHFERHVPRLARAFAWILFHAYIEYKENGMPPQPTVVTEYIDKYWREVDPYLSFQEDAIESFAGGELDSHELYSIFCAWYAERNPGVAATRPPSFAKFQKNITQKGYLGEYSSEIRGRGKWIGYRLRPKDEG